tara:strand:- start:249 stop:503 length:255 start_codon:yes stop_codon:yes gene_type:complete
MILDSLRIRRVTYGDDAGQYKGEIEVIGKNGKIIFNTDRELSKKILSACSEVMVESVKEVAELLTAEVIEHKKPIKMENLKCLK